MYKICHICKKESDGKFYCKTCRVEENKKSKKRRTKRFNAGICTVCGKRNDGKTTLCSFCQKKHAEYARKKDKERLISGMCRVTQCKNKKLENNMFCETHRLRNLKLSDVRFFKSLNQGLCFHCSIERYMDCYKDRSDIKSKFCQTCYLKNLSSRHLGGVSKWKELLNILIKQSYTCPYSGDTIVLGVNDSIDHILPKGKYPEKQQDINNLRWVSRTVNIMKYDLLDDEFCTEIIKIAKYLKNKL